MGCPICDGLDAATKARMAASYLAGRSVEALAAEYRRPTDSMQAHLDGCVSVPAETGAERISALIVRLAQDVETACDVYRSDSENRDFAASYAGLVREYRAAIDDAEAWADPTAKAGEVVDDVLGPLIQQVVLSLTEEFGRLRADLVARGADPDKVQEACKQHLRAMGQVLSSQQSEAVKKINRIYGTALAGQAERARQAEDDRVH